MPRTPVAILGASGLVSQRMQQRLCMHPWFTLVAVAGQDAGIRLSEIKWHLDEERPNFIDECSIEVIDINSNNLAQELIEAGVTIVFSALPSQPALNIEKYLVESGLHVFSNASAYRMHPDVPLVVADVNPDALVNHSPERALHACATNCTLIPILHPLSILSENHDIDKVIVRSEQALSGAGWKLLHNESLQANAIGQEIEGEAEKITEEAERILSLENTEWDVQCLRVNEQDGHLVRVQVHLSNRPSYDCIRSEFASMVIEHDSLLPSQPRQPMLVTETEPRRDQHLWNGQTLEQLKPSIDLKAGMTTTVQLKSVEDGVVDFTALSHNTIRGAAGGVVLLAELAYSNDLIPSVNINPTSSSSES